MLDHAISYTGLSIATPPGGGEKFFKVIHALMFIESNFIHFPQFNIYSLSYLLHDNQKNSQTWGMQTTFIHCGTRIQMFIIIL